MSKTWQDHEANVWLSGFIEENIKEGLRVGTRLGMESAMLPLIEQRRRSQKMVSSDLKESLLAPDARTEMLVPPRAQYHQRPAAAFE